MSVSSISSLERLTELADTWEKLGGKSGILCFREVTDRRSPFALKPSFIKRFFLWCTRPFRKIDMILGQKVIFFDQKSNLEAVHALAFDAIFSYISQARTTPEMDAAIQKVIDFSLSIDQQFGGKRIAAIFRKTVRALPPEVGIPPEVCSVASKILQKQERNRLSIEKTLLRTIGVNVQSCSAKDLEHVLKTDLESVEKLAIVEFVFGLPTCEIILRKIRENGKINPSVISRAWPHFPGQAQHQLLELALFAVDQSTSGRELEAVVHELKNLKMSADDCSQFCDSVIHRANLLQPLELQKLLSMYQDISSLLNEDQHVRFGRVIGQELSHFPVSKTPEQAFQELPKILKDVERTSVDLIPLRRCLTSKWKEALGIVAGDLHITGIKTKNDIASVQTVLQNIVKARPVFKDLPHPRLPELLEADWQSVVSEIYLTILKELEAAASRDIPPLTTEKEFQEALTTLRSLQKTLEQDPFFLKNDADKAKRTACREYVKALIQDLLRPLKEEKSPAKPSEKGRAAAAMPLAEAEPLLEAQPQPQAAAQNQPAPLLQKSTRRALISAGVSTLTLIGFAALSTWLAGGGYEEFKSGIEKKVFWEMAATAYGTVAAYALARVATQWRTQAKVGLKVGQTIAFAVPSLISAAVGGGEPASLLKVADQAVSAAVTGQLAQGLNEPVQEAIKEKLGEGIISQVVQEAVRNMSYEAAGQAVSLAHLPLESVQSAAESAVKIKKPTKASVSATKATSAAPPISPPVSEPAKAVQEPIASVQPAARKEPAEFAKVEQKQEKLSVSAAKPLPEVGLWEALRIAGKALVSGGAEATPVILPQTQDLARIAGDIPLTQVYSPTPQYVYSTPPTGVGRGVPT